MRFSARCGEPRRTVCRWRGRTFVHFGTVEQRDAARYCRVLEALVEQNMASVDRMLMDHLLYGAPMVWRVTDRGIEPVDGIALFCDAVHNSARDRRARAAPPLKGRDGS